jgi:hypothetical protein
MGMPWHKGINVFLMIATGYRDKKKKKDTWAFGKVKRSHFDFQNACSWIP